VELTSPALTAALATLDANEQQLASGDWTAIERDGRLLYLLKAGIAAERERLEQLQADLDSKQVTPRQVERYPVLSPREFKACISDDATESLIEASEPQVPAAMARKYTYADGTPLQAVLANESHPVVSRIAELRARATCAVLPNCKGCNRAMLPTNAWMHDGCPCNYPLGINDGTICPKCQQVRIAGKCACNVENGQRCPDGWYPKLESRPKPEESGP
jgi:hypothetical protein